MAYFSDTDSGHFMPKLSEFKLDLILISLLNKYF